MKGTVLDIIIVIIIAFGLGFGVLIGWVVLDEFQTQTTDFTSPAGNQLNTTMMSSGTVAVETFNYSFVVLIIGLLAAAIIGAFMINTHPAIFIISVLLLAIVVIISVPFSNTFYEISRSDDITSATNSVPLMVQVMDYLPEIIVIMGFIIMIALYMKHAYGGGV